MLAEDVRREGDVEKRQRYEERGGKREWEEGCGRKEGKGTPCEAP